ncbi:response regulator transcription factor [Hoeflea poritis]|uniref:Helix-turn-helix transcriptional regulator n=1 Tax=Hoeflea poritis TaxID=2993659 RepID=A0ABT4VVE6_9HYPH|nr:helix-turn-helix transcriptional regulator [Hoeflea poritis]MDA4848697.1 helix-turn-helix transcriptional regulator [Hoeflea poritis]
MARDIDRIQRWNEGLAKAIANIGTTSFAEQLLSALHQIVDFDVCMIFAYGADSGSVSLHHNMQGAQAKLLVDDYLLGPHLLDPFFAAATSGTTSGFSSMRDLAPDQFYRSEFYRHHYVRTGIADEIGVFFPVDHDRVAVLSVTQQKPKRLFSDSEMQLFASTAPIIEMLGTQHWDHAASTSRESLSISIDRVFRNFGEDVLTAREREIIALILKGHSSLSIGKVLEISEGTVKNHRKHAYGKLRISSQAELFSLFLRKLESCL